MSSTMSTSPLRLTAESSSKPERSERYTSAELMERLQEIDLPVRRRSAFSRATFSPAQTDSEPSAQRISPFETTDANGHHQTIDCHNMDFMDLPPRAELDEIAGQPKLLFSDVLHTNYQAGNTMPKKPCTNVPDLSLGMQMECAVYAKNAPVYINQARQAANLSVPRRSHDGCEASTCSCCVTCSTCPTLPSPPANTIGKSSRMLGHRIFEATWAHRRKRNSPPAPAVQQPANTLTFSRRPVPSVQQQPQGLIGHLLTAVRQDMLRSSTSNNRNSGPHVSFAPLPPRPQNHRPLAPPSPRPHRDARLPDNGLTASETAALLALVDGLSQHGIIANDDDDDDSPPATASAPPATTTMSPTLAYPPTHPLFPTFDGLTSSFSSFLSESSESSSEHSSPSSSSSRSSSSSSSSSSGGISRSGIPPPTPPHGYNHRKCKTATQTQAQAQTQTQRIDSVMAISTSFTSDYTSDNNSSVSDQDQDQHQDLDLDRDRENTHAARFQRLFGAGVRAEDLPGAFSCSSGECDGGCGVEYEYDSEEEEEEEGSV